MKSHPFKRLLCLVLAFIMLFSLSVTAFAAEEETARSECLLSRIRNSLVSSLLSHENFLTKSIVRTQFRTVAAAGAAVGCTTAASFLSHSLQNSPSDLSYGSTSRYAVQLRNSAECREIVNQFKARAGASSEYSMNGAVALRSSPDLYLSYNQVTYSATGVRTGNGWDITVTFRDTYDFAAKAWENHLSLSSAVTAINNYAAYAQSLHAIVPYKIAVTVRTSVSA